jgi:hypothetical protein
MALDVASDMGIKGLSDTMSYRIIYPYTICHKTLSLLVLLCLLVVVTHVLKIQVLYY